MATTRSANLVLVVGSDWLFSAHYALSVCRLLPISGVLIQRGFFDRRRLRLLFQILSVRDIAQISRLFLRNAFASRQLREYCDSQGVLLRVISQVGEPGVRAELEKLNPDLIVSYNGVSKWSREILAIPKAGCINVHLGELPKYRGLSPIIHALAEGESRLAISYHWMEEDLDSGPVILSEFVNITEAKSVFSLYALLNARVVDFLPLAVESGLDTERRTQLAPTLATKELLVAPDHLRTSQAIRNFRQSLKVSRD